LVDNAADSPQTISLSGSVPTGPALSIFPTPLTFGYAVIGGPTYEAQAEVDIANVSPSTEVLVTGVTITGPNAADFNLLPTENNGQLRLNSGSSGDIGFYFNPTSGSTGPRTATATLTTSPVIPGLAPIPLQGVAETSTDPSIYLFTSPSPLDFGSVQVGQTTQNGSTYMLVSNFGAAPLVISSIVAGISDYSLSTAAEPLDDTYCNVSPLTIPASGGCVFSVIFAPTQAGVRNTTLTINSNDPGGPAVIPVTGVGLALPVGDLSASALNFGYAAIGVASPPLTVNLLNTASVPLTISGITSSANYEVASNTCSTSVAPGASCTIGVTFTPPAAGSFSGTLIVTDNDAFGAQQLVSLSGIGATGPSLMILPNAINFGNQAVNTVSAPQPVTLTNFGDTPITFPANAFATSTQPSIPGTSAASAQFSLAGTTCGSTLALHASCVVNLQFQPTTAQSEPGTLVITDNARANPQTIELAGVGVQSGSMPTATTLTSSLNPANTGQSITFTATVAGTTSNSPLPTGSVTFFDGPTSLGSGPLNGSDQATFTTSSLAAGTHTITAVYSSDVNYAASTSAAISQVVNGPIATATTTTLTSSVNPSTSGQSITFTATVAGATSNTPEPTGSVTFLDGSTTLASETLNASAQATYTTSSLSDGSHSITAVYSSDANYAASTSTVLTQVVNAPALAASATSLASSANPATTGQSVTFTATVAGTPTNSPLPTGSVTFFDGTTTLVSEPLNSSATATYSTSTLAQGTHQITAQYSGDGNYQASTSSPIAQVVNAPANFAVSISPATLTIAQGQSGSATITATSSNGFNQSIGFACSGLPEYATCSFSPATVTPAANASATSTLSIATNVKSASRGDAPRIFKRFGENVSFALMFAVGLSMLRRRRSNRGGRVFLSSAIVFALLAGLATVNLIGCGSGSARPANQTPIGSSSVTVTATSGTDVQTTVLTVNVQ
jgi:hypothetical protein